MRVVILSSDLMDRSKLSAAWPDADFARTVARLVDLAIGADLVVVDLAKLDRFDTLVDVSSPIVGYGSHVEAERLEAAADAGIDAMPRSLFFRRLADPSGLIPFV